VVESNKIIMKWLEEIEKYEEILFSHDTTIDIKIEILDHLIYCYQKCLKLIENNNLEVC
jgi:hypothetical protein